MNGTPRFSDLGGRTAYALLGVPETASTDDVRRAFRRKMFVDHPDRGGSQETAQENEAALRWLSQHREEYDRYLREQREPPPAPRAEEPASRPTESNSVWDDADSGFGRPPSPPPAQPTPQPTPRPTPHPAPQPSPPRFRADPPPAPQWRQPAPQRDMRQAPAWNGKAVASFVLTFFGLGIIGGPMAFMALSEIRRTGQRGQGLAKISIVFFVLMVVGVVGIAVSANGNPQ